MKLRIKAAIFIMLFWWAGSWWSHVFVFEGKGVLYLFSLFDGDYEVMAPEARYQGRCDEIILNGVAHEGCFGGGGQRFLGRIPYSKNILLKGFFNKVELRGEKMQKGDIVFYFRKEESGWVTLFFGFSMIFAVLSIPAFVLLMFSLIVSVVIRRVRN